MTIHLPKDVERDILAEVHRGRYASVDDALVKAWQSLRRRAPDPATEAAAMPAEKSGRGAVSSRKKQPLSRDELNRRLLASGLVIQLPDPAEDIDDDDDPPIAIQGEPLSETIIRERR